MRTLYYRVVEAKVLRVAGAWRWDAFLLIQGVGKAIHGMVTSKEQLPVALQAAVELAYLEVTGQPLPNPDGQLPLL